MSSRVAISSSSRGPPGCFGRWSSFQPSMAAQNSWGVAFQKIGGVQPSRADAAFR
jgi:hypothetical protein